MDINRYKNKFLLLELLITEKCSFMCEHCMYDSGPHQSNVYMSDEILDKVKIQVDFLRQLGVVPLINIIGGEPTINFYKFEHILNKIHSWGVDITISTNGWWLNSENNIHKFFSIVSKYASPNGKSQNPITGKHFLIRISDDPYHEKARTIKNINWALHNIFESDLVKELNIPIPSEGNAWIFSQQWCQGGYYLVAPNGRGKTCSNLDFYLEQYGRTFCNFDLGSGKLENIHYDPLGNVADTCGFGSVYKFGTVDDNILYVIELVQKYKRDRMDSGEEYNCYNCRELVAKWKDENLAYNREKYKRFNTFDINKFLKSLDF
jgi:hypothetical protein